MATNTIIGNGGQQIDFGSSNNNILLGYKAGTKLTTTVRDNVLIGPNAAINAKNNFRDNTFIGSNTGTNNAISTLRGNTVIGSGTATQLTNGFNNTFLGYQSGTNVTIGDNNIAIGYGSIGGGGTLDNDENIAIGTFAGNALSSGAYGNLLIGLNAGFNITNGSQNITMGDTAMFNANGNRNIGFGSQVLFRVTGDDNVALGDQSAFNLSTGSNNISMGPRSLFALTTGSGNVAIGFEAGSVTTTGDDNVFIGYQAGTDFAAGTSNKFELSSRGNVILQGDFTNGSFKAQSYMDLNQIVPPASPILGEGRLYASTIDSNLYYKISNGTTYNLSNPTSVTAEILTVSGVVSPTITNTVLNAVTLLNMTLANPTQIVQKSITSINNSKAIVTLANGQIVKIGENETVTLLYDTTLGYWTVIGGNPVSFLNQAQTGPFNTNQLSSSVALNNLGDTLAVGNLATETVSIFIRTGSTWTLQQAGLTPSDSGGTADFGKALALSNDGNTLVVGGPTESTTGAAWIFIRSGVSWTQQGLKLVGTGATGNAAQGSSVAIASDGNTIAVGGPTNNGGDGATWIFTRSGVVWSQQGSILIGTGGISNPRQGDSISLSGDGDTLAVGGWSDNLQTGAFWIFKRVFGVWSQQGGKYVPTNGLTGLISCGGGLSLDNTGTKLLVTGSANAGFTNFELMIFYYTLSNNIWTLIQSTMLSPTLADPTLNGNLNRQIQMNGNATIAVYGNASTSAFNGLAYILEFVNNQWVITDTLYDNTVVFGMGSCIALSRDGSTAAVGSIGGISDYTYIRV